MNMHLIVSTYCATNPAVKKPITYIKLAWKTLFNSYSNFPTYTEISMTLIEFKFQNF